MDCAEQTSDSPDQILSGSNKLKALEGRPLWWQCFQTKEKMQNAPSYPFSGGEIKQMYFIRGTSGQSVPAAADPAPTALPSHSLLSLFTSMLKNKEMTALCTNMPYTAFSELL